MKVDLEVIASTSIKRHKPCSRIVWIGTEQQSLFLVDKGRVNVLYIPSGKTKRKIPQLSNIVSDTVCMATTADGGHLVGLQKSGEVFVWKKDGDAVKTVCGLSSSVDMAALSAGVCQVFASNDINKVLVLLNHTQLFLWQHDTSHTYLEGKAHVLVGRWTSVVSPEGMTLPSVNCQEASIHAVFTSNSVSLKPFESDPKYSGSYTSGHELRPYTLPQKRHFWCPKCFWVDWIFGLFEPPRPRPQS